MSKYTAAQARAKAKQIHDRFGSRIAAACAGNADLESFVGGFVGVEAGVRNGQIDENATRFEPGVFHHLKLVRDGIVPSWSHVTHKDLVHADDDALQNLATSYGLTQIMGWHMIHDLAGTVDDLRDPEKHLAYAVQLLHVVAGHYLNSGQWAPVLHIWNSGSPTGRTYDPNYVSNALAVKAAYAVLLASEPADVDDAASGLADGASAVQSQDQAVEQPAGNPTADEIQPVTSTQTAADITANDTAQPPTGDQLNMHGEGWLSVKNTSGGIVEKYEAVGSKIDTFSGAVGTFQARRDGIKALWSTVGHVVFQPFWAIFAFVEHMPLPMWIGVAGFVALSYVLSHYRQLVLGKIRDAAQFGLDKCEVPK